MSSGRVFRSFHHLSAVPVSELLRLWHVLGGAPVVTPVMQELLKLVDVELTRRSSLPGGIIPATAEDHRPEAG
ncbi:hypothetical protein [Pseudarthrobacter sp. NamB4]|uniref:hypothetical protein n=1 Tax=Pseudarthrobacter sp. NamB4 TaxID=2576837 RepID=UPI0010FE3694|nr:hypothetical protein [Pseudarthrobacter sp. NamB4]TLM73118.1 hypothetical protein FDW81_10590 [Pseudarthrobacter sp. NamB4]